MASGKAWLGLELGDFSTKAEQRDRGGEGRREGPIGPGGL